VSIRNRQTNRQTDKPKHTLPWPDCSSPLAFISWWWGLDGVAALPLYMMTNIYKSGWMHCLCHEILKKKKSLRNRTSQLSKWEFFLKISFSFFLSFFGTIGVWTQPCAC
jgi:hypothetical protein